MTLFADLLSTVFERRFRRDRSTSSDNRPISALIQSLIGSAGEVSGQALAHEILDRFENCDDLEKLAFFKYLLKDLDINPDQVEHRLSAYRRDPSRQTYRHFMQGAEPPRQEVIRRLNQASGATHILVKMRADLLRLAKSEPELQILDVDFKHLFISWFNRGFLVLRPINWESPAHILEKIIAYEAVHAIDSWDDLRRRLEPKDRRCFAFFHPAIPDEPLIFVEVALTQAIPSSIQSLLAESRIELAAHQANIAVFYSISNCQSGLAGISFGNSLIKQVVSDLRLEWPNLKQFVTLSPIPKFAKWFHENGLNYDVSEEEHIQKLAAYFLLKVKRDNGYPEDPVARFHLGNGAFVHQVCANADISEKGMAQSFGAMVNYLYDLPNISQNHEKFAISQDVAASEHVVSLANSMTKLLPKGTFDD